MGLHTSPTELYDYGVPMVGGCIQFGREPSQYTPPSQFPNLYPVVLKTKRVNRTPRCHHHLANIVVKVII